MVLMFHLFNNKLTKNTKFFNTNYIFLLIIIGVSTTIVFATSIGYTKAQELINPNKVSAANISLVLAILYIVLKTWRWINLHLC